MNRWSGKRALGALAAVVALAVACTDTQTTGPVEPGFLLVVPEACNASFFDTALAQLCEDTDDAEYTSEINAARDESTLISKVNDADVKLSEGKTADVVSKLTQYQEKVTSLRAQGKIIEPPGVDLVAEAQAIIDPFIL